jgi:hypothetical protein
MTVLETFNTITQRHNRKLITNRKQERWKIKQYSEALSNYSLIGEYTHKVFLFAENNREIT